MAEKAVVPKNQLTSLDVSNCPEIVKYINESNFRRLDDCIAYLEIYDSEIYHYILKCDASVEIIGGEPVDTRVFSLPASLTRIEDEAFRGGGASQYRLGGGVTYIGAYAFADLTQSAKIHMPDSVTFIHDTAFSGSSVTLVCSQGSATWNWAVAHNIPVTAK